MFRLKSCEGPVRYLYQQTRHHLHHNNNIMAYLVGYDPCSHLSKAFSQYPSLASSDRGSYLSFRFLHNLVYADVFGVSRSIAFGPRSCSFDTSGSCSSTNSDRIFVRAKARSRGFASNCRQPMLADLEQRNFVRSDESDATLVKVDNGSINGCPAKPPCFNDHRLSQKLVVAVDVDEGMYANAYACATLFIILFCFFRVLYILSFNLIDYMNFVDLVQNLDYDAPNKENCLLDVFSVFF